MTQGEVRIVNGFIRRWEVVSLDFLAARTPPSMTPNHYTIIGLVGAAVSCAGYAATQISPYFLLLANFGLFLNWIGDSMDGSLARFRKIERVKFGFFIDHTADLFGQLLIFLGFGLSIYGHFSIACLALIGYLMLSIIAYIRVIVSGILQITYFSVGPTEARLVIIGLNLLLMFAGPMWFESPIGVLSLFDCIGLLLLTCAIAAVTLTAFQEGARLNREDAPRRAAIATTKAKRMPS